MHIADTGSCVWQEIAKKMNVKSDFLDSYLGVVTLLCSTALTEALYGSNTDVVELTAGNFDGKVIQSDDIWLVEFYAPW